MFCANASRATTGGSRLLLVDDDLGTLCTFHTILALRGCDVVTESSVARAIGLVEERIFDLGVIDLWLDDGDGLSILRCVRHRFPVIMISGYADVPSTVEAMRLGAVDFLEKPIFEERLVASVESALTSSAGPIDAARNSSAREVSGAVRWADSVIAIAHAARDPRTLDDWAALLGSSAGALRGWCAALGIRPKDSLDLGRILRASCQASRTGWPAARFLNSADERTLARLIAGGGITQQTEHDLAAILIRQSFVTDAAALAELAKRLNLLS